ncbi:MAG: hypothetical protein COB16_07730 [Rhodobacteraceae bacterium]|nr:MAG: hypothetical protein COB16_07730 [Paracoccaceae bacterium]
MRFSGIFSVLDLCQPTGFLMSTQWVLDAIDRLILARCFCSASALVGGFTKAAVLSGEGHVAPQM